MRMILDRLRILALAISTVGALFKILHWKGADVMLIVGLSTLSFYYVMRSLSPEKRASLPQVFVVKNMGFAVFVMGGLFRMMHWSGDDILIIAGVIISVLGFILELIVRKT